MLLNGRWAAHDVQLCQPAQHADSRQCVRNRLARVLPEPAQSQSRCFLAPPEFLLVAGELVPQMHELLSTMPSAHREYCEILRLHHTCPIPRLLRLGLRFQTGTPCLFDAIVSMFQCGSCYPLSARLKLNYPCSLILHTSTPELRGS
jgi:hypothetical protein